MIINQITDGAGEWDTIKIAIPSLTGSLVGDESQEVTMYDAMFMAKFDIATPIEICGRSFDSFADLVTQADECYITSDTCQIGTSSNYGAIFVVRDVGGPFSAYTRIMGGSTATNTVDFPEFNMVITAKFD